MGIRYHSQCLDPSSNKRLNGRCWFNRDDVCLGLEWHFGGKRGVCLGLEIGAGDFSRGFSVLVSVPGLFLSATLDGVIPKTKNRELSIRVIGDGIYWKLLGDPMSWNSKTPRWRDGSWHLLDTLFGRKVHSERTLELLLGEIAMPEKTYPTEFRMFLSTWKRPRSPFVKRIFRAEVTPLKPIPVPGKGESSWDCGEDAVHSLVCPAKTMWEAVGETVESVMRSRIKYGGAFWRPSMEVMSDGSRHLLG